MLKVRCPKCNTDVVIDISKAIDENGEVFKCHNCGWDFRYTDK
jgi:predicted RNA-binding Zn-ribbon protein involved in translation (DUF1610 family)